MSQSRHGLLFYYLPKLEMTITGNCAKRFQDHDFDFLDGNYRRIYEITTALVPEALTIKQLASKVVSGSETMHQAFAVPLRVNDLVNITCVHCIFRYPESMETSPPTRYLWYTSILSYLLWPVWCTLLHSQP